MIRESGIAFLIFMDLITALRGMGFAADRPQRRLGSKKSGTTDDRYKPTRRDVVTAPAATALSMSPIPVLGLIHEQREGDVHMAQTVETLLRENIHGVFSEPDTEKRHKAIARKDPNRFPFLVSFIQTHKMGTIPTEE
jgi:hypothetical protein